VGQAASSGRAYTMTFSAHLLLRCSAQGRMETQGKGQRGVPQAARPGPSEGAWGGPSTSAWALSRHSEHSLPCSAARRAALQRPPGELHSIQAQGSECTREAQGASAPGRRAASRQ